MCGKRNKIYIYNTNLNHTIKIIFKVYLKYLEAVTYFCFIKIQWVSILFKIHRELCFLCVVKSHYENARHRRMYIFSFILP